MEDDSDFKDDYIDEADDRVQKKKSPSRKKKHHAHRHHHNHTHHQMTNDNKYRKQYIEILESHQGLLKDMLQ